MANQKLTQLSTATTVNFQDITYVVTDPTGTPSSKNCTTQSFVKGGASQGACSDIIDTNLTPSRNVVTDANGKISVTNDVYCRWRGSSSSAPQNPVNGDIWNDTTSDNTLKIYANNSWISLN
ncbi:MAG: hypothetical protein GX568_04005 [Candidatus Gastranaerophilales bacterium]|nr:hypothetical protein [Candidatus Gastranaerophilales bacterium]